MVESTASAHRFGWTANSKAKGTQASIYSQAALSLHLCSYVQGLPCKYFSMQLKLADHQCNRSRLIRASSEATTVQRNRSDLLAYCCGTCTQTLGWQQPRLSYEHAVSAPPQQWWHQRTPSAGTWSACYCPAAGSRCCCLQSPVNAALVAARCTERCLPDASVHIPAACSPGLWVAHACIVSEGSKTASHQALGLGYVISSQMNVHNFLAYSPVPTVEHCCGQHPDAPACT